MCIGVSHEAGTEATLKALQAAAYNGARTILITAKPDEVDGNAELAPDIVVSTPLVDTSWCHTVGYVSPLLAITRAAVSASMVPAIAVSASSGET